ncbi:MAG: serine/threonine protein kinase [Anaerolineaceae bacterium]|nr:serine/threonine protein kinase [Anaerolineaceae bacterium]
MDNLIGHDIGRYHIVEKLGRGGMAAVYKAFDTHLERNIAIKVILPGHQHADQFLKRFDREAKTLAKLNHPNIVSILDYGDYQGMPYLVMEYISGGTLKERMGQPLHYKDAIQLVLPIAEALSEAHQNNIIHRDIKPANILIDENGSPLLSDFGISKILESDSEAAALTGTGVGIGTPEYMAPEQGHGKKIDQRADIYALGIVFYELVTGKKPFQADTPMATLIKQLTEPLPHPSQYIQGLPPLVEQVIFKSLTKNPDDRYQTMQDFTAALKRILKEKPLPPQVFEQTKDKQPVSIPSVNPSDFFPESNAYSTPITPKPEKKKTGIWVMGGGVLFIVLCGLLAVGIAGIYYFFFKETPTQVSLVTETPQEYPAESLEEATPSPTPADEGSLLSDLMWDIPYLNADVMALDLFETPSEILPVDDRIYLREFSKETTRFIGWELTLSHDAPGEETPFNLSQEFIPLNVPVCNDPNADYNFCNAELTSTEFVMEADWVNSFWWWSYGWEEPGNWSEGIYQLNIYIEDEQVASQTFEIY